MLRATLATSPFIFLEQPLKKGLFLSYICCETTPPILFSAYGMQIKLSNVKVTLSHVTIVTCTSVKRWVWVNSVARISTQTYVFTQVYIHVRKRVCLCAGGGFWANDYPSVRITPVPQQNSTTSPSISRSGRLHSRSKANSETTVITTLPYCGWQVDNLFRNSWSSAECHWCEASIVGSTKVSHGHGITENLRDKFCIINNWWF